MRKKEFMPRVKRTREEMQANAEQYTYCYVCKEKLKEVEMMFEDDPKANAEVDYGRVKRNATQVNFGVSGLADIMSPSNYYVKRGRPKKHKLKDNGHG